MMYKLIMLSVIQIIMTGRRYILIILILSSINGCDLFRWDVEGGPRYSSYIKNATNDTFRVIIGTDELYRRMDTVFYPEDRIYYSGNPNVFNGDNVVEDYLFQEDYNERTQLVQVYKENELIVEWAGPASDMGKINHFYNYNSWTVETINGDYELEFTIYESDLNQVK